MPGAIVTGAVTAGQQVKAGATLLSLEAEDEDLNGLHLSKPVCVRHRDHLLRKVGGERCRFNDRRCSSYLTRREISDRFYLAGPYAKTIFLFFPLLGIGLGYPPARHDDWGLKIVSAIPARCCSAARSGAACRRLESREHKIRFATGGLRKRSSRSLRGGGSGRDLAVNFWRDEGHQPFTKPPVRSMEPACSTRTRTSDGAISSRHPLTASFASSMNGAASSFTRLPGLQQGASGCHRAIGGFRGFAPCDRTPLIGGGCGRTDALASSRIALRI